MVGIVQAGINGDGTLCILKIPDVNKSLLGSSQCPLVILTYLGWAARRLPNAHFI